MDARLHPSEDSLSPEEEWHRIVTQYPSLARQFERARPILPWVRTGVLQRRARRMAGEDWALLSQSAFSLDALYSSGNAHSLLTVQRLARILERSWRKPDLT